jgi:hypothetical protein
MGCHLIAVGISNTKNKQMIELYSCSNHLKKQGLTPKKSNMQTGITVAVYTNHPFETQYCQCF